MSSIYHINKGINKPIEFRGLYGQYIAYLAVGLVILLISFALLYIAGMPLSMLLPLILGLGAGLFFAVTRLSRRFGIHGLSKFIAKRDLPKYIKFSSRRAFTGLKVLQSNAERQTV
jgi:cell division protein FtsW (lipid II flippase)